MAVGILIPITQGLIQGVFSDRINAMRSPALFDGQAFMGGAGHHNPFKPLVTPVYDFPIPTVGDTFYSRTHCSGAYPPNDPKERFAWNSEHRLMLRWDWAQGYTNPNPVPASEQSYTFVVVSVPSTADLSYDRGTGKRHFRVGTVVYEGTFAQATTYWGANF